MKIRDLDLDQYVIVYDVGKSEDTKGMTVVGRVEEIVFNDDGENTATINSLGNFYDITDDNYFDLWTKSIEDKTEHIAFDIENTEKAVKSLSNDLQQRKRSKLNINVYQLKPGDHVKVKNSEGFKKGKVIATPKTKSEVYIVSIRDDYDEKIFFIDNTFDIELIQSSDTVNHPSHYNYGEIEVIDYCDQVCKTYPPELAPYVFNAIKYLSRANHKNGREDIQKAQYYVQRLFDKWEQ